MFHLGSDGNGHSSRTEALRRVFRPLVEEMGAPAAEALSGPKKTIFTMK